MPVNVKTRCLPWILKAKKNVLVLLNLWVYQNWHSHATCHQIKVFRGDIYLLTIKQGNQIIHSKIFDFVIILCPGIHIRRRPVVCDDKKIAETIKTIQKVFRWTSLVCLYQKKKCLQGSTLTFEITSLLASDNLDVTSQNFLLLAKHRCWLGPITAELLATLVSPAQATLWSVWSHQLSQGDSSQRQENPGIFPKRLLWLFFFETYLEKHRDHETSL